MGMGLDRATARGDRPLAVLLLCELETSLRRSGAVRLLGS
jgi:hypothetical protein